MKLHPKQRAGAAVPPRMSASEGLRLLPPMNQETHVRSVAVLLFLLTLAAVIFGGLNFTKEREFAVPDDGAWWIEHDGNLVADRVDPSGPAAKAGVKAGDQLVSVNGSEDPRHRWPGTATVPYRHLVEGQLLACSELGSSGFGSHSRPG